MTSLFAELKRRNVYKVAFAYVVVGWVVLQVAEFLQPLLQLPQWTVSLALYIGIIGFPFALLFAWAFELTPDGLRLTEHVDKDASITAKTGKTLNRTIIALMGVAILLLVGERLYNTDPETAPDTDVAQATAEDGAPGQQSIAVLPFVNMSKDPDQEYFSDGISEELLNGLAKISELQVAARTSSFAFKGQNTDITEIGKQLKVGTVLEGSVRKAGNRVRITAQLINVDDGYHLWSETYDRELDDIFAIQDEISRAIVEALKVHLTDAELEVSTAQPVDVEAYNFFLLARHNQRLRTESALELAVTQYQQALDEAPDYAPAYVGQALAIHLLSSRNYGRRTHQETSVEAQKLLNRAFALQPDLPEAHAVQGLLYMDEYQLTRAESSLKKAISNGSHEGIVYAWLSNVQQGLGRNGDSTRALETAFRYDPLHPAIRNNVARDYAMRGQAGRAREMLTPGTSQYYVTSSTIEAVAGNFAASYEAMNTSVESADAGEQARLKFQRGWFTFYLLGELEGSSKDVPTTLGYAMTAVVNPAEGLASLETVAAPDRDDWYTWGVARGNLALGNEAETIDTLESFLHDREAVTGDFGGAIIGIDLVAMYACALTAQGRTDEARQLADKVIAFVKHDAESGGIPGYYSGAAATSNMVLDRPDEAVVALKQGWTHYMVSWLDLQRPCLDTLQDRTDFADLKDAIHTHTNRERARLGWPPLQVSSL